MELPICTSVYDPWNGDHDCDAVHDEVCENCLCNWYVTGGTVHPQTGVKLSVPQAEKLMGQRDLLPNQT